MNIIIRADANRNIGMGHVMRCLSIADIFYEQGHEVIFLIASDNVQKLIKSRGYENIVLHTKYDSMEDEIQYWSQMVADIIIVDSYYVTIEYLSSLRHMVKGAGKLVYIDDLAAFPYPVDFLINYNVYGTNIDYNGLYKKEGVDVPLLILGPTYAPLRSMFRGVEKKIQPKTVQDVLISTGGTDLEHIALSIVKAKPETYVYHILIGALNVDKDEIEKLASDNPKIVLHESVSDMMTLIRSVDICVSAAGSTMYEICACGVPMITYSVADNQLPGAAALEKMGLAKNLGDMRQEDRPEDLILNAIDHLADDYNKRCYVGSRMQEIVDGLGAERIVSEIMNKMRNDLF